MSKQRGKFRQNFVAFSENLNFKKYNFNHEKRYNPRN
jgi:hypothetical protein